MVETRPDTGYPTKEREERADHAVAHPMNLQIRRQVTRRAVLEAGRAGQKLQLLRVEQRIDVPTLAEQLDRALRLGTARSPSEVIADCEHTARRDKPTALLEKTRGFWCVHERLDRVCEVRRTESGRQIAIVPLETHHAVGQSRFVDEGGCELRLNRADGDA